MVRKPSQTLVENTDSGDREEHGIRGIWPLLTPASALKGPGKAPESKLGWMNALRFTDTLQEKRRRCLIIN